MIKQKNTTLIASVGLKNIYILFSVYLIANVTYLLNVDGLYWDDWVGYNQEYSSLIRFYGELQNTIHGYFSIVLFNIGNGIYGFRLALFSMYFVSGLMLVYILKTIKIFNNQSAYLIVLFYLISPVFHTKVALSIIPFYVSVFLFFVAWYWLAKNIKQFDWYHRLAVLTLFFFSFTTNSLLVFYGLVLLFILYKEYYEDEGYSGFLYKIKDFVRRYIDFILLPILFFIFKLLFLQPNGLYENYNKINIENWTLLERVDFALFQFIESSIISFWMIGLVSVVIVYGILLSSSRYRSCCQVFLPSYKVSIIVVVIGLLGMFLAVLPYIMVGKVPVPSGWNSRFQILTLVPSSMVLYGALMLMLRVVNNLLSFFVSDRVKNLISVGAVIFLISILVSRSVYDQHRFNVDWFYQVAIQQNFIDSSAIYDNKTFVVYNRIRPSLAYSRVLVYYEWTGLLKQGFNDDSRLMVPPAYQARLFKMGVNQSYKHYNFSKWELTDPLFITINYNQELDTLLLAKLYWYRLFDSDQFKALSRVLVSISYSRA